MGSDRQMKYGLNERKKKVEEKKTLGGNVFGESDSDDEEESTGKGKAGLSKGIFHMGNSTKRVKYEQEKVLKEDDSVYDYDDVYDRMKGGQSGVDVGKSKTGAKSKEKSRYIGGLMEKAKERERDRERLAELKIQKEREREGDEFADKETFVTSAYKRKIEEREEEEKQKKAKEAKDSAPSQKGLGMLYRNVLDKKTFATGDEPLSIGKSDVGPDKNQIENTQSSRTKNREGDRVRDRDRARDRDRHRDRSRDSARERYRDKDRERYRHRDGERNKDKDRDGEIYRYRDGDRYKNEDRDRSRGRERERYRDRDRYDRDTGRESERYRDRDGGKERGRHRERERERDGNRERDAYRERDRRGMDRQRDRYRDGNGDRYRYEYKNRERDEKKYRDRSRETQRHKESGRERKRSFCEEEKEHPGGEQRPERKTKDNNRIGLSDKQDMARLKKLFERRNDEEAVGAATQRYFTRKQNKPKLKASIV
eukprot:Nk52_evm18s222 gene=Nk52_evmTU18s222